MKTQTTKKLFGHAAARQAFITTTMLSVFILVFYSSCQKEISREAIKSNVGLKLNTSISSKIIYHDVVPDITLVANSAATHRSYDLDLNGDGVTDFSIDSYYLHYHYSLAKTISVSGLNKNGVASDTTLPLEMNLNGTVASDLHWIANTPLNLRGVHTGPVWYGNWSDTTDHYLGLKINSGGSNYYGWIRLDVSVSSLPSFTVKDYAYNSIPDQPILAGQTK